MPDDLDDLDAVLRRAMASLDGQTPAGYFDALPARTLARLDDAAPAEPREALDDIRDLASETRARLSAQRAAQGAPGSPSHADLDDVAASSSVWKAVALPGPQPAPAVSQPPMASRSPGEAAVPSAPPASADALASPQRSGWRGRRAAWVAIAGGLAAASAVGYLTVARRGAGSAERTVVAAEPVAVAPSGAAQKPSTSPTEAASVRAIPGDAGMAAVVSTIPEPSRPGAGTAASGTADGKLAIELPRPGDPREGTLRPSLRVRESMKKSADAPRIATLDKLGAKKESRPIAKRAETGKASKGDPLGGASAKGALADRTDDLFDTGARKPGEHETRTGGTKPSDTARPGEPAAGSGAGSAGSGSAQVPLDQLLGESGAAKPAPVKAKPERTSLSSDDIKRGMSAVARKAQACFAGTQGLASLRLTVAPSGRIVKVTVSGMFTGSPTGACVERAVRAARFPPWEGGPQSFNYSYLLSD